MEIETKHYLIEATRLNDEIKTDVDSWNKQLKATDTPKIYWEISCLKNGTRSKPLWKKLLVQNSQYLTPSFLFIEKSEKLFIGCEQGLFVIDAPSGQVTFQQELFAPFLRFYQAKEMMILVLCELELLAFDKNGNFLWKTNFPEVLNELQQTKRGLEVTDLSETVYEIDFYTGKFIKSSELIVPPESNPSL